VKRRRRGEEIEGEILCRGEEARRRRGDEVEGEILCRGEEARRRRGDEVEGEILCRGEEEAEENRNLQNNGNVGKIGPLTS
jgi:hypothetical protein